MKGPESTAGVASPPSTSPTPRKRIRVGFVTSTYPRYLEDHLPRFVGDLAKELAAAHDVEVLVIAPYEGCLPKEEDLNGVHIERSQYSLNPERQCVAYGFGVPDNLRQYPRATWPASTNSAHARATQQRTTVTFQPYAGVSASASRASEVQCTGWGFFRTSIARRGWAEGPDLPTELLSAQAGPAGMMNTTNCMTFQHKRCGPLPNGPLWRDR